MVEPVTWHPSADRATTEALVAEQDRRLVALTAWLADAGVQAAGSSRTLQVLTPADSRITYPLELMLRDAGANWVVRQGRERFRDGLTGVRMYWTGTRFAAAPDAPVPDVGAVRPGSGDLELHVTTVHPPSSSLQLGGVAETAMRKLSDSDPTGWGICEPVTHPWSQRELTAYCRDRAPTPSQVVVLGNGVLGQIQVERTTSGVQERVRLSGPPAGVVDAAAIESLAEALAGSARSMIVAANPGRLDGTRSAQVTMPALPYAVLVGRSVVAQRGVAHAEQVPLSRHRILDGACWCRLDTGPQRPYELLTAVCSHFGIIPSQAPG